MPLESIRRFRIRESKIYQNKCFLKSGKYRYDYLGKHIYYKENERTVSFLKKLPLYERNKKNDLVIKLLNLKSFYIHNKKCSGLGEIIMFTRTGDMKIFNLTCHEIITIYEEPSKFYTIIEAWKNFENIYNLSFLTQQLENLTIKEKLIDYIPYEYQTECAKKIIIQEIVKGLEKTYSKGKEGSEYLSALLQEFENKYSSFNEYKILEKTILKNIDGDLVLDMYMVHGDLNFNNILFSNSKVYVIDFEDTETTILYYDLINLFFVEAMYRDDLSFLKQFLVGEYDDMFQLQQIILPRKKKEFYLQLYVIERLNKFEYKNTRHMLKPMLIKYLNILERLEILI